jgi:hypothetical protein
MAPPALVSLDNFSDVQFRDVIHRRTNLVAPTANVLQKLYTHLNGNGTPQLSAAEAVTSDGDDNNAQYSLMLSSNTKPLSANTLTSANLATWTADAVMTVNRTDFTVRSNVLTANAISCNSISVVSDVTFANANVKSLIVMGDANIDTTSLRVDSTNNRVGIVNSTPAYPLDVTGDINTTTGIRLAGSQAIGTTAGTLRINTAQARVGVLTDPAYPLDVNGDINLSSGTYKVAGTTVISSNGLGTDVTASSLTSVGVLTGLRVSGNSAMANITATEVVNVGATGAYRVGNLNVLTSSTLSITANASVGNLNCGNGVANAATLSVSTTASIGGNASVGNLTTNAVSATAMTGTTLSVTGDASLGNVSTNAVIATAITSTTGNVRLQSLTDISNYTWSSGTSAVDNNWNDVAYGLGTFVAVSSNAAANVVMTSSTGTTWTARSTNTGTSMSNHDWTGVTYGGGLFVAVASNDYSGQATQVMTSPTGAVWTLRTTPATELGSVRTWESIAYGGGLFVAVASSGRDTYNERVMTSSDGITWTLRTSAADNAWRSVTYGNGTFVAVASSGSGNRVMTSTDGLTWTIRTSAADNDWYDVTYGNGLFVAVASSGTGNRVMTSPDGITWTIRTSAADHDWYGVTYGNGFFVAVARSGTGSGTRVMTSRDGITWAIRPSAADRQWEAVAYGGGTYVAVASSGTGDRAMTWSPISSTSTANVSGLMYYNDSTGLLSYGSFTVDGLNAKFGRLEVSESLIVPELSISGSLSVPGDLTTGGNLTTQIMTANSTTTSALSVTGSADFDGIFTRTFSRNLGTSIGDAIEVCQIDTYYGHCAAELVLVCRNNPTLSRIFQFCVVENATSGNYHRLLPITADAPGGVAVEIRSTSGLSSLATLRLVRIDTSGGTSGDIDCHLKVHYDTTDTTAKVTELSGTASGVTVSSTIYQSTPLTRSMGRWVSVRITLRKH